jgi:hypothetical protein
MSVVFAFCSDDPIPCSRFLRAGIGQDNHKSRPRLRTQALFTRAKEIDRLIDDSWTKTDNVNAWIGFVQLVDKYFLFDNFKRLAEDYNGGLD